MSGTPGGPSGPAGRRPHGLPLIADYTYSPLRVFHDEFHAQSQHPPELWSSTYDRMPMNLFPQRDDHLPPGKGDIDWARVVGSLSDIGFRGPIILELSGQEGDNPRARLEEAVEARQFIRSLCRP